MCKSKAPKAPDPVQTASAQTSMNIGTALAQNSMNRVNQVTPDGSLTYTQSGSTKWTDPVSGKVYDIPNYTATTTLSPEQQRIKAQSDAAELNLAGAANTMSGQINTGPFSVNDEIEAKLFDLGNKRLAPELDRSRASLETRLANQGIKLGSAAYDRAMAGQGQKENDAYNQLALSGRSQAYNEALSDYNLPLNRIIALLSGSQVQNPSFVNTPQASVANTDYAGLVNANYQAQMSKYNADQAAKGEMIGGLFGLAGKTYQYR